MPLKVWSSGEVLTAGDLNGNFDLCVRTDAAKTIAATHTWSAPQSFAAGSAAAPGIYLNSDSDTGLYHIGADRLGLAVAGAKVVEWSAGAVAITGTLDVSGAVALASTLAVTGNATVGGTLGVTGAATLSSLLTVDTGAAGEHLRVGPQSGDPLSAVTTIATIYGDTLTNGAGPRLAFFAGAGGASITAERQNGGVDLDLVFGVRQGGVAFTEALRLVGSSLQATFAGALAWGGGAAIASSDDVASRIYESGWTFTNVPADGVARQCDRFGQSDSSISAIMTRAGSVTGLAARLFGTITAGTITVEVYKNAVPTGLTVQFSSADGESPRKTTTQAAGVVTVVPGDLLNLHVVGSSTLSPTNVDVAQAALEVTF